MRRLLVLLHLLLLLLHLLLLLLLGLHLLLLHLLHGDLLLLLLQEELVVHVGHLLLRLAIVLHLVAIGFFVRLLDRAKLVLAHLEVNILQLLDLAVDSIDLDLVSVHLGLVILQLCNHLFELLSALFKVRLVLVQLLVDIWAALLRKNILQLDIELLFLLDKDVLFRNFLSLGNQALLQTLNLLDQFVGFNVRRFELSPSVHIQWLLELVREELGLLLLLQQLLLEQVDLSLQVGDALRLLLCIDQLPLAVLDIVLEVPDVLHFLLIVDFTLLECRLLDLNLLVQQVQLLISLDQLSRQYVSFIHHHFIIFFLLSLLSLGLRDDILQASDVIFLCLDHFFGRSDLSTDLLDGFVEFRVLLDERGALGVLLLLLVILLNGLLFELTDMTGHPLEVLLQLGNLRVRLKQVLRVQITIGSHLLVKIELELELGLSLEILLLELRDQVILKLDLLQALVVPGISRCRLLRINFLVLLQLYVLLTQLLHADRIGLFLETDLGELLLVHLDFVLRLPLGLLLGDQIAIEELALMNLRIDLLLLVLDMSLLILLHLDLLLVFVIILLTLERKIFLTHFGLVSAPLDSIFLLCELPKLFLRRVQIGLLSGQVSLMLRVLRHESRVVLFSLC